MRCAVLGDPIAHSLSPVLHRAAYAHLGLDWRYDAVRVPAGGLASFLDTLDNLDEGWRGLSLTMPLKREVLDLVAARDASVDRAGGANTVVLTDGEPRLHNTDLPGAAAAVREVWSGAVGTVAVLGAGATAVSVALALCDLGAERVRLLARSPERASGSAALVAIHPAAPEVTVGRLDEAPRPVDVVVSTVPASAQQPLLGWAASAAVVFEVRYDPWPTPLAGAALAAGVPLVGGLDLLVHQAALQVELFTGRSVPISVLRDAGTAALTARG